MDEILYPSDTVVKQEPLDFTDCINSCDSQLDLKFNVNDSDSLYSDAGRDFASTITVEEMDIKFVKTEEHLQNLPNENEHVPNVSKPSKVRERKPTYRLAFKVKQALKLAKAYADEYAYTDSRMSPFPNCFGPTIIFQCPGCMLPSKCASQSAFLKLLEHVPKYHPHDTTRLFYDILERYKPFIDRMRGRLATTKRKPRLGN
ncbi:putative WRKY transcription factor 74 [Frankliniella fusca]|uniref:WRKY transcription factor 74 n=1 Tax=Frankliniella fusca TaxID=407009 RepID=A0AAE1HHV1_9NEOP|nr:putative WRKY transcription factor 74 [Frankliniella fusca]KAK3917863.1 putative WRKY transcription factor 74 [Frankliniella fusca]KAK3921428.1 putative WRKY transcription factor 74 [Frankliniella fusca]KAK3921635.1 putative WRKY transcription factor 74 [Frankliniella fusca]KAK3923353.1 putative WRKY transcription factor 74 [Frankliniella fusca]